MDAKHCQTHAETQVDSIYRGVLVKNSNRDPAVFGMAHNLLLRICLSQPAQPEPNPKTNQTTNFSKQHKAQEVDET